MANLPQKADAQTVQRQLWILAVQNGANIIAAISSLQLQYKLLNELNRDVELFKDDEDALTEAINLFALALTTVEEGESTFYPIPQANSPGK